MNNPYLKLSEPKYSKTADRHYHSLESYLEKNNHNFNKSEDGYVVYVQNKNEAMRIGLNFPWFDKGYFDGSVLQTLNLNPKVDNRRGPRNIITDNTTGKKMSLRQFRKVSSSGIKEGCLSKNEVIKRKLLTKGEIDKAVAVGNLEVVSFEGGSYINRQKLAEFLIKRIN
jgi:hypothetical protein